MSFKLDEEDTKEAIEFATRLGGSVTSVFEQMLFDYLYNTNPSLATNPLFARPAPGMPAYHNFLVSLGLNVAPWVAALFAEDDASKKGNRDNEAIAHAVREFTEGGVLYTVPRLVRIPEVNYASGQPPLGARAPPQGPSGVHVTP
jgi:hypothetical protein